MVKRILATVALAGALLGVAAPAASAATTAARYVGTFRAVSDATAYCHFGVQQGWWHLCSLKQQGDGLIELYVA